MALAKSLLPFGSSCNRPLPGQVRRRAFGARALGMRVLGIRVLGMMGLTLAVTVSIAGPASAQSTLRLSEAMTPVGGSAAIAVSLDHAGPALGGWSFGVCHDAGVLSITDLDLALGSTTATIQSGSPPDFLDLSSFPDGWTMGVVIDFMAMESLPAGADYELAIADYTLIASPPPGGAVLSFCETLGVPPIEVIVVDTAGTVFAPVSIDIGLIEEDVVILPGSFVRGDFDGDGTADETDYDLLRNFLFPDSIFGPPSGPMGCDGGASDDAGDINDNEYFSVADLLLFRDHLDCGAALPSPMSCGMDPDDDDDGFGSVDFDYVVTASTVSITGSPGDPLDVEILVRVLSPTPIKAVQFGLAFGSALTPGDPEFAVDSGITSDFSGIVESGNDLVLTVGRVGCGDVMLPGSGGFQTLGVLRFTLEPFGIFPPVTWYPDVLLNGLTYRATVVDDDYRDHHPLLVSGSAQFARGNANNFDSLVDIADSIFTLSFLFTGGLSPECEDAADANNDGRLDIADPIYALAFLFGSGPPLSPWPQCGWDLDIDALGCDDPMCP